MHAKDRLADLAAPGVVVVATKLIKFNFLLACCLILLLNCTVDLNSSTPGAVDGSCNPTSDQLTSFLPIMTGVLQTTGNVGAEQGCGNCHVNGIGSGAFPVLAGSSQSIVVANYCSAVSRLAIIDVHPTQSSHAQVYTTADLAQLIAWVNSF